MSILAGIEGLIGSGEIGFALTINFNKGNVIVDKFFIIKAFYISLFLKMKFEIKIGICEIKFVIYIFNMPLFGVKVEKHEIIKKILGKMIYEDFILNNNNQLS